MGVGAPDPAGGAGRHGREGPLREAQHQPGDLPRVEAQVLSDSGGRGAAPEGAGRVGGSR